MPMCTLPVPGLENASADLLAPDTPPNAPAPNNTLDVPNQTPFPPDVPTAFPGPIARRPDIARAWLRDHFEHAEARHNFDIRN